MKLPFVSIYLSSILLCSCSSKSKGDAATITPTSSDGTASKNGTYLVKLAWTTGPTSSADSSAKLTFFDAAHRQVKSIDSVTLTPWMTSMGHGTSMTDQKISPIDGQLGAFNVDGIYFIMGGAWDLRVSATVNATGDTATVPVNVP